MRRWQTLFLALSVFAGDLYAAANVQERIIGFGAGMGLPQLVALEGQALLFPKFQMGFAYGFAGDGGNLSPTLNLPSQTHTLVTGDRINLQPSTKVAWAAWSPFIRFYPNETNFYLQLTLTLLKPKAKLTSTVTTIFGQPIDGASVTGDIEITQVMPTFTIGHQFTTEIFFLNFALGASYLANVYVDKFTFSGELPDSLGGTSANESVINASKADIESSIQNSTSQFKREFPFIPSFMLTVGFII